MSIAEKLTAIAENEQRVYDAGKKAEYDAFWDKFQNNGEPAIYFWAFAYGRFSDENYNPKYPIRASNSANAGQNIFYNCEITDTKVPIYITGSLNNAAGMFYWNKNIKTIRKIVVTENVKFSSFATGCTALENITFEGVIGQDISFGDSTLLSKASMENIISVLSDTATGMTLTLSKTAKESAFTADEWQTLIATKSNWTISLV